MGGGGGEKGGISDFPSDTLKMFIYSSTTEENLKNILFIMYFVKLYCLIKFFFCKTSPWKNIINVFEWLIPGNKVSQGYITGVVGIVLSALTSEGISQSEFTRFPPNCNL